VSRKKTEPLGSMLPLPLQFLAAWLAVWFQRALQKQVDYLMAENRILKEKLGDRKLDLTNAERRRLAVLGKELGRKLLAKVATLATADTILRWYREQVAKKYDGSKRCGPGRPRKAAEIVELVLKMVRENESWGYTRVKGALKNLGYTIGRSTIKRILCELGIDPAPIRGKRMPWSKFIKAHLGSIVGMDFFTIEVMTLFGIERYHVLFVSDIGSRVALNPRRGSFRSKRMVTKVDVAEEVRKPGRDCADLESKRRKGEVFRRGVCLATVHRLRPSINGQAYANATRNPQSTFQTCSDCQLCRGGIGRRIMEDFLDGFRSFARDLGDLPH
jgi:transposase